MPHDVIMPQMGESIAEGTITAWLKNIGEAVARDEPLFEMSTDKVDAEIPSPVAGVLLENKVQPGQAVAINTIVAIIGGADEKVGAGNDAGSAATASVAAEPAAAIERSPAAPAVAESPATGSGGNGGTSPSSSAASKNSTPPRCEATASMCGRGCRGDQRILRIERMGRVPYEPMHALQQQRHTDVAAGAADDTFFLLEHDPVITLGRNRGDANVLADHHTLAARGVALVATGRGGDVTYHGPGQIVGYPIIALQNNERDIKAYVGRLEEIMIRTARDFDIPARRDEGLRGIWVGNDKLGAVGVRIAEWTTLHGFAFNVSTDLDAFSLIVPCGLAGRGVTSMERLRGQAPALAAVEARLVYHAGILFDRRVQEYAPTPLGREIKPSPARLAAQVQP